MVYRNDLSMMGRPPMAKRHPVALAGMLSAAWLQRQAQSLSTRFATEEMTSRRAPATREASVVQ